MNTLTRFQLAINATITAYCLDFVCALCSLFNIKSRLFSEERCCNIILKLKLDPNAKKFDFGTFI